MCKSRVTYILIFNPDTRLISLCAHPMPGRTIGLFLRTLACWFTYRVSPKNPCLLIHGRVTFNPIYPLRSLKPFEGTTLIFVYLSSIQHTFIKPKLVLRVAENIYIKYLFTYKKKPDILNIYLSQSYDTSYLHVLCFHW